jgi:hypothetical protein
VALVPPGCPTGDSRCWLELTIKNVLDLTTCRIFRVNQRSTRSVFSMHVLLLNTTATNLEVSVEPERDFSFMNATKTMARNNLIEQTLNNLMIVGLHSPSLLGASTESQTHMEVGAKRELEEFVDACMARWDSIKARRCRSEAYNNDKDIARLQWLAKERSGLSKRRSKQAILRCWPPLRRKLLKRKERKEWEMENLSLPLLHSDTCLSR